MEVYEQSSIGRDKAAERGERNDGEFNLRETIIRFSDAFPTLRSGRQNVLETSVRRCRCISDSDDDENEDVVGDAKKEFFTKIRSGHDKVSGDNCLRKNFKLIESKLEPEVVAEAFLMSEEMVNRLDERMFVEISDGSFVATAILETGKSRSEVKEEEKNLGEWRENVNRSEGTLEYVIGSGVRSVEAETMMTTTMTTEENKERTTTSAPRNRVQLNGSVTPTWFPGYTLPSPLLLEGIEMTRDPGRALHEGWRLCRPRHLDMLSKSLVNTG